MQPHLAGHAGVCEIILDRPEALNAIDTAMATRLAQACAELASESNSRVSCCPRPAAARSAWAPT